MHDRKNRGCSEGTIVVGLLVATLLATCSDPTGSPDPLPPNLPAAILFRPDVLDLASADANALSYGGTVVLSNTGALAVGPVTMSARTATMGGVSVPGIVVRAAPSEIPTLNVGADATISLAVTVPAVAQAGAYLVVLQARAGTEAAATLGLRFEVPERTAPVDGTHVTISAGNERVRQGDVVRFEAQVRDSTGAVVEGAQVGWSVEPADGGLFDAEGRFVPYGAGEVTVVARAPVTTDGNVRMATIGKPITVLDRGLSGSLRLVGMGRVEGRQTSDLWVHGDHAYTGTWGQLREHAGNRLYAWTLDAGGMPTLSGAGSVAPSPQAPAKAAMAATTTKRRRLGGIELDGVSERKKDW